MLSKLLSSQIIIYHCILFFSFSLSVNYFINLEIVNYLAYVFFHLTLIYLFFYFFHFSLIFVTFLYGIFFDIFLVDNISPHLITFMIFVIFYYFTNRRDRSCFIIIGSNVIRCYNNWFIRSSVNDSRWWRLG